MATSARKDNASIVAQWIYTGSEMSSNTLKNIVSRNARHVYSRSRGGKRDDLGGMYLRSSWEANYARWLNYLMKTGEIKDWKYEAKTFVFEKIKRGTRTYTPDFMVIKTDDTHEWHEVKGWMDAKSKTRLSRMERFFPEEKVIVVGRSWFKGANSTIGKFLANWEHGDVIAVNAETGGH